jgi:hypothetical protein
MCRNAAVILEHCEKKGSEKSLRPKAEPVVHHRKRGPNRIGKKIKDMSVEEKRAYWREHATIKRKRLLDEKQDLTPTGRKVMGKLERNADTLKKIKEDFPNEVSERP